MRGPEVDRSEAFKLWVKVAAQSFGGPAGQIAVIHRLVVDEKKWLSESRFLHALSFCMLLPGPEAQQLATYVGWLLHGVRGGLIAGCLFIVPGFVSILLLSFLYAEFGEVPIVAGLFYGLKPAVVVVVFEAVARLKRKALHGALAGFLAVGAFVALFFFQIPFPIIIVAAAMLGTLVGAPERHAEDLSIGEENAPVKPQLSRVARTGALWLAVWIIPILFLATVIGPDHVLIQEATFFSKTAVVTFGGAYSVLAYVAQQAVEAFGWLAPGEMLDGLGMAETTPGPLIQVVQFVGFMGAYRAESSLDPMVLGFLGSIITTWVTFAPCFLFIFVGAPYVEYLRGNKKLNSGLSGITAAVVGVVLNLAVWFSLHTLFAEVDSQTFGPATFSTPNLATVDLGAIAITVGAVVAMFRFKVGMLITLGFAAGAGMLIKWVW